MMYFDFNFRAGVSEEDIIAALQNVLQLKDSDMDVFMGDKEHPTITYEIFYREAPVEFSVMLTLYCPASYCLQHGKYNELYFALPLSAALRQDIVIDDHSSIPYQWMLVEASGDIFVVSEIVGDHSGIIVNYASKRHISVEEAFAVLPGREYVEGKL